MKVARAYVYSNEFEEAVLRQNRYHYFVACFSVIIEKRQSPSMGLDK